MRFQLVLNRVENDAPLFRIAARVERGNLTALLELVRLVHEQRRVTTVVDDEGGAGAVGPDEGFARAPPVVFERFALPRKDRDSAGVGFGALRLGTADDNCG